VVVVRLYRSNLRKLVRRPATWVTFLLLVGLLVLIFVAVGASVGQTTDPQAEAASRLLVTFPGAYTFVLSFILGLGGLLAVTYGAAIAGSEWSWGTLKAAVARGESRTRYTLLGYGGVATYAIIGILAAFIVGVGAAALGAVAAGVPLDGMSDATALGELPELYARGALAIAMNTALGYAIATIARSQLAGIGVGIGLYFGEQFAGLFLRDWVRWLPFDAASAVISTGSLGAGNGGGLGPQPLDPNVAIVVVAAWLIGALAVSAAWAERAEISG
jgi:ABC-type transport system involved in multi-copper enzyme maturation permease subunit